jgi:hypothetical protein
MMSQPTPFSSDENAIAKPHESADAILPAPAITMPPQPEEDLFATTRKWILELVEEIERIDPDLPSDMAENHSYYAHGGPRRND